MTDEERYHAAVHAMQTGVMYEMEHTDQASPKHLRVGVNVALRGNGSIVALLVSKGIITQEEVMKALADGMEEEARAYEARLSAHFNAAVRLH
jgi:hypothetical protein